MRNTRYLTLIFLTFLILQGCWSIYRGAEPLYRDKDIYAIEMIWNNISDEESIEKKLDKKLNSLIDHSPTFNCYTVLYQSNVYLKSYKRIYTIKLFRTIDERDNFFEMSEPKKAQLSSYLTLESFQKKWNLLSEYVEDPNNLKLKESYSAGAFNITTHKDISVLVIFNELFPDLHDFYLQSDLKYNGSMIYRIENLTFEFDKNGNLISCSK